MHFSRSAALPASGSQHRAIAAATSVKAHRRDRQHLYPLEEYQDALATGGIVWSFCGIHVVVPRGDASDVVEATEPAAEDCITCVDIWRGSRLVRL